MLPERVKDWREIRGLSRVALDKKAGLAQGHTRKIERGERPGIAHDTVKKLAEALDVSIEELDGEA